MRYTARRSLAHAGPGPPRAKRIRQVLHALDATARARSWPTNSKPSYDPDAALSFDALRAGDITGTARAFGSLVTAGVTPQSAAAVVGLDGVEVKEVPCDAVR